MKDITKKTMMRRTAETHFEQQTTFLGYIEIKEHNCSKKIKQHKRKDNRDQRNAMRCSPVIASVHL